MQITVKKLRRQLRRGKDIKKVGIGYHGYCTILKALLQSGTAVNKLAFLRHACKNNDLEMLKLVVASGLSERLLQNALPMLAFGMDVGPLVSFLLHHGANVNAGGGYALTNASARGLCRTVDLLLRSGANVHATVAEGTALRQASSRGHPDVVLKLIQHGVNIHAGREMALYDAVRNGHIETARILLQHGADVHIDNYNFILLAVVKGHVAMVSLLLENGATLAITEGEFRAVVSKGEIAMADLLIKHGLQIGFWSRMMLKWKRWLKREI